MRKEKIMEEGTYKMVAKGNNWLRIPDLELTPKKGKKKIWKVKEMSVKEVTYKI